MDIRLNALLIQMCTDRFCFVVVVNNQSNIAESHWAHWAV